MFITGEKERNTISLTTPNLLFTIQFFFKKMQYFIKSQRLRDKIIHTKKQKQKAIQSWVGRGNHWKYISEAS